MQTIKDTNTHPMTCLGEVTTRLSISSCLTWRRLDSKINVTPLVTQQLTWKSVDLMFDQANMQSCWAFIFKNSALLHYESLMMTARFTNTNNFKQNAVYCYLRWSLQETGKQLYRQSYDVKERKAIILDGI